ncbi:hypothetical protein BX666DRAFT_2117698 [Dichotomocladium elegans]|nr:hypothetical protein BX666DRAFT_2117698 [Dichotomocladium elegans]
MLEADEEALTFLPTEDDRLKAEVSDLRHRCKHDAHYHTSQASAAFNICSSRQLKLFPFFCSVHRAREEKRRLEREVLEERLALIAAARFSEEIRGIVETRGTKVADILQHDLFSRRHTEQGGRYENNTQGAFGPMDGDSFSTVPARSHCVLSAGWNHHVQLSRRIYGYSHGDILSQQVVLTFDPRNDMLNKKTILDTFCEPYYLLFESENMDSDLTIAKHTLPHCVPLQQISAAFVPHDLVSFLRVVHDFLLAYVSRREQVEELKKIKAQRPSLVSVTTEHAAKDKVTLIEKVNRRQAIRIQLFYQDKSSDYPSEVRIRESPPSGRSFDDMEEVFMKNKLLDAYQMAFNINNS